METINAKNTKLLACILVIGFILYHGILHWSYGMDSCKWLLSDGRFNGNQKWQPYGCMMHYYSRTGTRLCLRYLAFSGEHSHFVFIGDSRIRQLYLAFLEQVESKDSSRTTLHPEQMHSDMAFTDTNLRLRVEFVWSTFVSQIMIDEFRKWKDDDDPPNVIVAGNALWSIGPSNASVQDLEEYKNNLKYLAQAINTLSEKRKTRVLWVLQAPVNAEKLQPHRSMITNEQIELYNEAASQILLHSRALLWSSTKLVAQGSPDETADGISLGPTALKYDTQMLLNMYCNDHMNFNDGSCCRSAKPYTTLQVVTFSIFGVCFIIGLGLMTRRWLHQLKNSPPVMYPPPNEQSAKFAAAESDVYKIVTSLARMGLIMAYFFLCDRTNFFMKENKYFSHLSFWVPCGYVFTLGLFFTEDSQYTKVLHRDQTDEWKGWMQLMILIYHMTDAIRILPIYMHIRVLVSTYLFLSGYGHFCYFWQRGDAGIVRFFQVLFRLNFMTVMLCLCMNKPYMSYYFVPLISFWFMMAYLVLALPPQITATSSETNPLHYLYLVLKMVGLFTVITVLYMFKEFFEKIFVTRPWKALFVTRGDDISIWWFRSKIDRYSISYGMVFAAAYMLSQRYNLLDDNNHSNLFSRGISLSATLGAVIGLGSYTCFSFLCRNSQECNKIHSYIVFVPIVSYIVLRNISGALRTRYSSLFAWFGRISLELYISQFHIWLAADADGVLVLLPGYPVLNLIITSFIFVCAAHEVNALTRVLTPYAVPADWRLVLLNVLLLFLAVLIPIGIHYGMS